MKQIFTQFLNFLSHKYNMNFDKVMDDFNEYVKSEQNELVKTNISDEYFEYDTDLYEKLVDLRNLILINEDLKKYSQKLSDIEREITLFHGKIINSISFKYKDKIDLVGMHGQTVFHSPEHKISKQLGDGSLLSQLVKKKIIYDFRQKDLINGGQGAPLTPVFHYLLSKNITRNHQINFPICFINIGGITNITKIIKNNEKIDENLEALDVGPGNCMIDEWVRRNSKYKIDKDKEFPPNL